MKEKATLYNTDSSLLIIRMGDWIAELKTLIREIKFPTQKREQQKS